MKKTELLSPAGNFDALKGAINAGADAVYLGGELYGARAYADNFTQDEIIAGLHMAHLFGKKIYLTVNTLVKEKELDGLYDFLLPFYREGLDGVIVQDLGALRHIRKHFPSLPVHASTQMTLTGRFGAELMKEEGISRIVPARELSLEEIKKIRHETNLEIETFIHGAMCYCYSGQCLLSSILGGRSGNRGRCAQPCRLPYKAGGRKESYPLSMKDMCTLNILPQLIDAGIDSFKIEGRMKKPAYAAGVTAIYRKYIDLYERDREHYQVDKRDLEILNSLYIRSEISNGYYQRTNGREMISISSPAYLATDDKLLTSIESRYINEKQTITARAKMIMKAGEPAELTLWTKQTDIPDNDFQDQKQTIMVVCKGEMVQKAEKQPLTADKAAEQIQKSGNSFIRIVQVETEIKEPVFMPVRALNELRRKAVAALEAAIIEKNGYDRKVQEPSEAEDMLKESKAGRKALLKRCGHVQSRNFSAPLKTTQLHISVRTADQLKAAVEAQVRRIYLEYYLLSGEIFDKLKRYKNSDGEIRKNPPAEIYASTPYIVREKDISQLALLAEAFAQRKIDGVLIRNLESFRYLSKQIPGEKLVTDSNLYVWNREALRFWEGRTAEFFLPLEGNRREWKELLRAVPEREMKASTVVYGRLPMMITANCLKKTTGKCNKIPEIIILKDRYEKQFPVYTDCQSCYNVIYNSVPLSLHGMFADAFNGHPGQSAEGGTDRCVSGQSIHIDACFYDNLRLDFTVENREDTLKTIHYFQDLFTEYREPFYKEYTTGHYKRGVE